MAKAIKHDDLYIGQLIVVDDHPEQQVYTIASIQGASVTLQWREGGRFCSQDYTKFGLLKPTLEQIEYSIAANGPLVSTKELVVWA